MSAPGHPYPANLTPSKPPRTYGRRVAVRPVAPPKAASHARKVLGLIPATHRPARASALTQTFASARERPFARWLRALGMPPSGGAELPDWATLSARSSSDWQAIDGIGPGRGDRLAEFFARPELRAQVARLHAAGVQGF